MSQKFENLSALIDGEELSSDDVIEAVKGDADLMQKWKNYHLIRDGLRKELPSELNFDIAGNVAKALESEPAILAPKKTWRELPLVSSVIPFAKQGGQMAVAASVAVAMILGVQQVNQPDIEQPFSAAPPILGIKGGLSPVSFEQTRSAPKTDVAEQKRRMQAYFIDHKEQMRFKTFQVPVVVPESTSQTEGAESDLAESTPE
ncbi:sigma-E factor negative regulatory protein [Paraglaciecola sp.]|uniref:sigma-E factor negative regulatory protein n=1 Tax=Paraglaciecola sp. TaxID=1920173 RepID=UPI003EF19D42